MPLPAVSALQASGEFQAMAVSRQGVVPQAYVTYHQARRACDRAGKRLCSEEEWTRACRGRADRQFPYGDTFERSKCNVYAYVHPGLLLHDNSSVGHRDPRLNLIMLGGDRPLLRRTGITPTCASEWRADRIYDMVGNLDEWIEDEGGVFKGGFYARSTTRGCESEVRNHAPIYSDYSTGFRCCQSL